MAQYSRKSGILTAVGGFVIASVVAGALVAGMVTPALAVTTVVANTSAGVFDNLPSDIVIGAESQQNTIYANRNGQPVQIATIYNQNRQVVSSSAISKYLKYAAVDGEDRRFYQHGGVDVNSIVRAIYTNATTNTTSGSSTLDMQLVKNILVQEALQNPDPTLSKKLYAQAIQDNTMRKLKEMKLAIGLDKKYTKDQILTGYLNIVGFGGNTYGVESGAERYFSTTANNLTVAQAASLVAIVQQPNLQNLSDPSLYAANKVRRDEILKAMLAAKNITQAQFTEAMATPIAAEVKLQNPQNGCLYASDAKFACDYVKNLVPTLSALGSTATQRANNWALGGYKIYTSIDLNQQDVAQAALSADAPASETRFALGAAADAVEPGTGRILVMAQNKDYNDTGAAPPTATAINFSTDRQYGGSAGFQTGSTYKIFTLADWLQNGHGLNEVVNGSSRTFQQSSFSAPCVGPFVGTFNVNNDTPGEGGSMTVTKATANSVNAAFVSMAQKLNLCDIRNDATAMGVHRADGAPLQVNPASVLGTNEIAPLTMAGAIATIGANGTFCTPTIVDKLVDPSGKVLPAQPRSCTQALAPNIASTMATALSAVMTYGTGTPGNPHDGVPIVGKTGTTDVADQNWLIATTTKAALAVWVGNWNGGKQDLRRITVAGTNGYYTKFNIFKSTMKSLDAQFGGGAFPAPDPTLLKGSGIAVPNVVGGSASAAQGVIESLGLTFANGGTVASALPVGEVAQTSPAAGSVVAQGDTVTVYTSDGTLGTSMPNVVGAARQDAMKQLQKAGLSAQNVTVNWVASSPKDMCTVTTTNPAAGSSVASNAAITLTVADGGPTDGVDPGPACP
ncbi:MAG: penicillin-binding protein [Microbacteriaceae bacterium]|nr:penicillin-binding protein [Microbacteriaceae bacterium]